MPFLFTWKFVVLYSLTGLLPMIAQAETFSTWRNSRFTPAQLSNPAISGPTANPDADSFSNLAEYAFALEPFTLNNTDEALAFSAADPASDALLFTYTQRKDAADLLYQIEYTSDLTSHLWNLLTSPQEAHPAVDLGPVWQRTIAVPQHFSSREFLRLRLHPYPSPGQPPILNDPPQTLSATLREPFLDATLRWIDRSNQETGYRIERRPDGTPTWRNVATTNSDTVSYQDTHLAGNTSYQYRVTATLRNNTLGQPSSETTLLTPPDSDGDNLTDTFEIQIGTDPNDPDSDNDGLSDAYEVAHGTIRYTNPDPEDDEEDPENNGGSGFDPTNADSNNNGILDGADDADGDGLTNAEEATLGTDPTGTDSDSDGVEDSTDLYPADKRRSEDIPTLSYAIIDPSAGVIPANIAVDQLAMAEDGRVAFSWWETNTLYKVARGKGGSLEDGSPQAMATNGGYFTREYCSTGEAAVYLNADGAVARALTCALWLWPYGHGQTSERWGPATRRTGSDQVDFNGLGRFLDNGILIGTGNRLAEGYGYDIGIASFTDLELTSLYKPEGGPPPPKDAPQVLAAEAVPTAFSPSGRMGIRQLYRTSQGATYQVLVGDLQGQRTPIQSYFNPPPPALEKNINIAVINDSADFVLYSSQGDRLTYYAEGASKGKLENLWPALYRKQILNYGEAIPDYTYWVGSLSTSGRLLSSMAQLEGPGRGEWISRFFISEKTTPEVYTRDLRVAQFPAGYRVDPQILCDDGRIAAYIRKTNDPQGNPIPEHNQIARPGLLVPVELAVDANRDGVVEFGKDKTTTEKPFRFWLNDDDDGAIATEADQVPPTAPDYQDGIIKSRRDLEDFARLHVNIGGLHEALESGAIKATFEWKEVTGTPKIKLYRASKEGEEYLTDDTVANALTIAPFRDKLIEVIPGQTTQLPQGFWTQTSQTANIPKTLPTAWFLFEGSGEGKGRLVLTFWKGTEKIGEGGDLWLDLKNIKKMYKRSNGDQFTGTWNNAENTIVFVHGWNMSPEGRSQFAETFYKRLWHRGFKGNYAAFQWETDHSNSWQWLPYAGGAIDAYLANYNGSEHTAWQAAVGLKSFVDGLPGTNKHIAAHSMGNIVASEALRLGMSVTNYALMQAAVPSACYDDDEARIRRTSISTHTAFGTTFTMWDNVTPDDDLDPATRAVAYRGRLQNVSGNLVSFYLPEDFATSYAWEINNDQTKPENGPLAANFHYKRNNPNGQKLYKYHFTSFEPETHEAVDHYLNDAYEAMPFACRTWGKAVGAWGATEGAINDKVNLGSSTYQLPTQTKTGFGEDHSGQFNARIQNLKAFYNELLRTFIITPNP